MLHLADNIMKIAQFIDTISSGGAETMLAEISRGLKNRKFDVVVIFFENNWLEKKCIELDIKYINLSAHFLYKKIYLLPLFVFYLGFVVKRNKVDVLHSHLFGPIVAGAIAARLFGISHIGTMHDTYTILERPVRAKLLRLSTFLGTKLVVVSNRMKTIFLDEHPELQMQYEVIVNGVDLNSYDIPATGDIRKSFNIDDSEIILLHVGRLVDVKRQDLMVQAVSCIDNKVSFKLLIAGDGPNYAVLQNQINEADLQNKVILLGHREDVKELLASSDCFILVSDSEGLSCSLLEAMAAGLPAVVTNVGGNAELVQSGVNGFVIDKGDCAALVSSVEKIVMQEKLRNMMSEKTKEIVNRSYSIDKTIESYISLYKQ